MMFPPDFADLLLGLWKYHVIYIYIYIIYVYIYIYIYICLYIYMFIYIYVTNSMGYGCVSENWV